MAFRPVAQDLKNVQGIPNYNSGSGTAYKGGRVVDVTTGVASVATGTDVATHVVPGTKTITAAQSLTLKSLDLIPTRGSRFYADISDENSDGFDVAMTGGTTTTIVDSVNRKEADSFWVGGVVCHLGLKQTRRITASDQSDTSITIEKPFLNQDGTNHTNAAGEKYSVTTLYPQLATGTIDSTGDTILSETKATGTVLIKGIPNLEAPGFEFVEVELTSEA